MNKEDIFLINLSLTITYFIINLLFLITGETHFKELVIAETFITPFLYLLFYIVTKIMELE